MSADLRARFDAWGIDHDDYPSMTRRADGTYFWPQVESGWQAVQAMHSTGDDARDTERLNWLESTMREYGDGYTEPREASIGWIGWQQSPEELHFPGLRKAIDAAITGAQGHE
jgi:hypothetical protein